jgi:hypothetical protein
MTAIHLHLKAHVGTTYKRALQPFADFRDHTVSGDFSNLASMRMRDSWSVRSPQGRTDSMRKPRDFDADLKALEARANQLKTRKQQQLGELVITTGADALPIEELAGVLLAATSTSAAPNATDRQTREGWRKAGAAFFQRGTKASASGADRGDGGAPPLTASAQSSQGSGGAA